MPYMHEKPPWQKIRSKKEQKHRNKKKKRYGGEQGTTTINEKKKHSLGSFIHTYIILTL